jgi:type IV secretion system protein VirB2
MKLSQLISKPKQAAVVALMSFLSSPVFASGQSLPWDGPLTVLRNNLTGPFAASISVVAFVAAGATLIFGGEDMSSIAKRILYIVLGVCVVVFGLQFLSALGIVSSGALI